MNDFWEFLLDLIIVSLITVVVISMCTIAISFVKWKCGL